MARRKNKKFIDPRYFMNEKMERLDERSYQPNELAGDVLTQVLSAARFDSDGEVQGGLGYPLSDLLGSDSLAMSNLRQLLKTSAKDPDMGRYGDPESIADKVQAEIKDILKVVHGDGQAEAHTTEGSTYILKRTDDSIPQSKEGLEKKRQSGEPHGPGVVMSSRGW